jgi:hypothetical protein
MSPARLFSAAEVVERIVEGGIDLLAGGEPILGQGHEVCSALQRKQIFPDASGQNDIAHYGIPFYRMNRCRFCGSVPLDNLLVTLMVGKKILSQKLTQADKKKRRG